MSQRGIKRPRRVNKTMTKEEKFVVYPLIRWFKSQKADWKLHKPRYGTAATGWDLEASRKNKDLLVEAKYINGPFLASFAGMITAPLANRPQHFIVRQYRGWSYSICWAIGANYAQRNLYQLLFDYFARNLHFYKHYVRDLRIKYIFFIENGKVARVTFDKILLRANLYKFRASRKDLSERRKVANELIRPLLKFV